jgi:hypothetical protein
MMRVLTLLLLACLALAAFAGTATVTVAGKTVSIPTIEQNGKSYVDIAALMKLLGGKVTIKPSAPATGAVTGGTAQLPGENGQLGAVYTLVKSTPLYFSLKSAEYTVTPVRIGDTLYAPKANEKLLVAHFTVQNPAKTEQFVRWDSLKLTAVDAMNVNRECVGWGDEENKNSFAMSMKPAQTTKLYAVIIVPAKGVVPKLMVMPPVDGDGGVLRYDLRDKVTRLAEPFADPADKTGATALETVTGKLNTAYPYGNYDVTVEQFSTTKEKLGDIEPEEEGQLFIATVVMKNRNPRDTFTRWDSLLPVLTSTDGDEISYQNMLLATGNRPFAQEIKSGNEVRVRLVFNLPKDITPKTLAIQENESRTFTFEVKL